MAESSPSTVASVAGSLFLVVGLHCAVAQLQIRVALMLDAFTLKLGFGCAGWWIDVFAGVFTYLLAGVFVLARGGLWHCRAAALKCFTTSYAVSGCSIGCCECTMEF